MYHLDTALTTDAARRVRAARAYAGLSIQDLADQIGLGLQTVKRIEAGTRTARRFELWAIAEACSVPREFFDIDLDLLSQRALHLERMLDQMNARLARIETRLGVAPQEDDKPAT